MIKNKIIEYRGQRGAGHPNWSGVEDDYCYLHSMHMAREGYLSHAPAWALNGKSEAVAMRSYEHTAVETVAKILWEQFEHSPMHRRVLLMPNLAVGVYVHNYNVYVTVRGW